jgi:hypothetical protein
MSNLEVLSFDDNSAPNFITLRGNCRVTSHASHFVQWR